MKTMQEDDKRQVPRPIKIIVISIVLAFTTIVFPRYGPEQSSIGNHCGRLGSDSCYVLVLNAGFPLPFMVDKPYVSVPGSLGFLDDEFRPLPFLLDALFFGIVFTFALEMGKPIRQTINNLQNRLRQRRARGVLVSLIVSACFIFYLWLMKPALQPCSWLDKVLSYSGCIQVFATHTSIPSNGFTDVAFSSDARVLASSTFSEMGSWPRKDWHSLRSGVRVWRMSETWNSDLYRNEWTTEPINSIAVSPDGMTIATGSNKALVQLWRLPYRRHPNLIMQHADPIMDVEFSPDGEKVASISQSEVRIWSVQDGGLLYLLERYPNEEVPSEIAFTPDGNLLSDGAQVWNLIDGTHIRTLGEGSKRLTVAFSPDGTLVAVNGEDTEVELWKVSDGLLVRTFGEKKQWTRDVAFSLDGRILASIPLSRTSIQVWRVSDGTLLRTIEIPMRVSSMVFLPNGALVLGVPDGRVILWDVNIGGN